MGQGIRYLRFAAALCGASAVVVSAGCGGGGGDGPMPPPVNNTPASIRLSQSGPLALSSGSASTVTAFVLNSGGAELAGVAVLWETTDAAIARVDGGTITAAKVGTATITASTGSIKSTGLAVNVSPGTPAKILITTQPGGATVAQPLVTQPVVELRDASDNLATTSTIGVSAAIATGGGTIGGTATVASVNGVVTFANLSLIGIAGARTLSFSAPGATATASASFQLTPGAPSQLVVAVQPNGAAVAQPFATQPKVQIQDAGGNLAASSTLVVTTAVTSGTGALAGTTSVAAIAGVATFTDLTLTGLVGAQTLGFAAAGVTAAASTRFTLAHGAPAQLVITRQPVGGAVSAPLLTQPQVELRDVSTNLCVTSTTPVAATISFGGGTLVGATSAVPTAGIASFANLSIAGVVGDRELTFAATGTPPVASTRFTLELIVYGVAGQKIRYLDVGGTFAPTSSAGSPPTFTSRASSLASVDNAGQITAKTEGQAWIISNMAGGGDSVLTIVPRSNGGPILRTSLASYTVKSGNAVSVDLVLDPRSTPMGSVSLFVTASYDTTTFQGTLTPLPSAGVTASLNQPTRNVYRFSLTSATGIATPITFGRLQFTAGAVGEVLVINVTAVDAFAPDGTDLRARLTSTYLPLVSR